MDKLTPLGELVEDSPLAVQSASASPVPSLLPADPPVARMLTLDELRSLGAVFYASGLFRDLKSEAQAIVKIIAGQELGIGPMSAMTQIQIVEGKPTLTAPAVGARIKASGRYDYRVVEHSVTTCHLRFFERGAEIGDSVFTMDDARAAGLAGKDVWKKYPRNMLFARAITNGARWYCADVFNGAIYTPEELGDAPPPQPPSKKATPLPQGGESAGDGQEPAPTASRSATGTEPIKNATPEPPAMPDLLALFGGSGSSFKAWLTASIPGFDGKTITRSQRAQAHQLLLVRAERVNKDSAATGSPAKHAADGQGGGAARAASSPPGPESWVPALVCNVDDGPANLKPEHLAQIIAATKASRLTEEEFSTMLVPYEITDAGLDPQEVPGLLAQLQIKANVRAGH